MGFILFILALVLVIYAIKKHSGNKKWDLPKFSNEEKQQDEEEPPDLPYRKKDYPLTLNERKFFNVIKPVIEENNWLLFSKVRLEDLLWIPRYTPQMLKWRGYIRSRHIDFVICDRENIRPFCAIELDDSYHNNPEIQDADKLKDDILRSAELPLLRIPTQNFYNAKEISENISRIILRGSSWK